MINKSIIYACIIVNAILCCLCFVAGMPTVGVLPGLAVVIWVAYLGWRKDNE